MGRRYYVPLAFRHAGHYRAYTGICDGFLEWFCSVAVDAVEVEGYAWAHCVGRSGAAVRGVGDERWEGAVFGEGVGGE